MALSLILVLILCKATISNAVTHADLTTRAPLSYTEATTAVHTAEVQEYASKFIHFILICLQFNFLIMSLK